MNYIGPLVIDACMAKYVVYILYSILYVFVYSVGGFWLFYPRFKYQFLKLGLTSRPKWFYTYFKYFELEIVLKVIKPHDLQNDISVTTPGSGHDKKKGIRALFSNLGMRHLFKPECELNHALRLSTLGVTKSKAKRTSFKGEFSREVTA